MSTNIASEQEALIWQPARDALSKMAFELEERFVGGHAFFDALDEALRTPMYFRALVSRALHEYTNMPTRPYGGVTRLVASGKFGEALAQWVTYSEYGRILQRPTLVLPGGLRHNDLPPMPDAFFGNWVGVGTGDEFVFVDDSYYLGRTYGKVKAFIEGAGGAMLGAVVLYDGSPEPPVVSSFFGTTNRQG